jgi:hypothetical protein
MAWLIDALAPQDCNDCAQQNPKVQKKGAPLDILNVAFELLLPGSGVADSDLRKTGDTWAHIMPVCLARVVSRQVTHQKRPRSNQTHLSCQDIP